MEVCVSSNTTACQDISSSSSVSSAAPTNSTNCRSGDLSMHDLRICLTEFLSSADIDISTSVGENTECNVVKEDECKEVSDENKSSNSASEKCLSNCVIFPAQGEHVSSVDGLLVGEKGQEDPETYEIKGCAKSVDQCHSQSLPLPTPLKLVSAMKGSREKHGIPPKKLTVSWATDVYDPTPTAVSHVPSSKNHRYRNDGKRYGKNKQKGGGKRSGRGKDKKQARKNGGGSTRLKPLYDDGSMLIGVCEPQVGIVDYDCASSDPFCGSSFLKKSVKNLHFPVAEAT